MQSASAIKRNSPFAAKNPVFKALFLGEAIWGKSRGMSIIEKFSCFSQNACAISGDLSVERSLTIMVSHSPAYIWAFMAFNVVSIKDSSFRMGITIETDGRRLALGSWLRVVLSRLVHKYIISPK